MKRSLVPLAFLSLAAGACSPAGPASPGLTSSPSGGATPSASPSATGPVGPAPNVTCQELSFYLDPALASSFLCETVPASTFDMEPYPAHTRVTLEGYPLVDTFHTPHISVYPVSDYAALVPASFPGVTTDLEALASGAPAPVFSSSFGAGVPFLPVFNAAQVFFAHYDVVPFTSGDGIRYLTEFTQYTVTVNNTDLFYTFQGLTDDGLNWVSAILPISHPTLMANSDNPPGGMTWEDFAAGYETYITAEVADLEALAPSSFSPSIDDLDTLVASIAITP